jgi:hypothetical protein
VAPPTRSALLVAAKFALIFVALMVPWRWLGKAYSLGFSLVATVALEAVVDAREHTVRFEPVDSDTDPQPGREWDVRFTGTEVATGARSTTLIEARELGYIPFATFVALASAAPLAWRRRRTILAWGLAAITVRLALAVGLPVLQYVGAVSPGTAVATMVRVLFWSLIDPPDMMYAWPVLAFILALHLTRSYPAPVFSRHIAA